MISNSKSPLILELNQCGTFSEAVKNYIMCCEDNYINACQTVCALIRSGVEYNTTE
jgi:hypothetical protein